MELWISWFDAVLALRQACVRKRTSLWMTSALVGLFIRDDLLGVTSFVRACLIEGMKYRRLLYFFHSPALHLQRLMALWVRLALRLFFPVTSGNYMLLIADGLKILEGVCHLTDRENGAILGVPRARLSVLGLAGGTGPKESWETRKRKTEQDECSTGLSSLFL